MLQTKIGFEIHQIPPSGVVTRPCRLLVIQQDCHSDVIRLIPRGTVDENLRRDLTAGPKALDPNDCRQPTLDCTIFVWKS